MRTNDTVFIDFRSADVYVFGEIKIDEFFMAGWFIYLFFGVLLMRDFMKRYYPILIVLGLLMTVVSILIGHFGWETIYYNNIYDFSPIMIIRACGTFAFFLWLEENPIIKTNSVRLSCDKIVAYLSKLTFEIYLCHAFVMNLVKDKIVAKLGSLLTDHLYISYCIVVVLTCLLSAMMAVFIEGVISFGRRRLRYTRELGAN